MAARPSSRTPTPTARSTGSSRTSSRSTWSTTRSSFHTLELVASNPFLGELKEQLGDATRRAVTGTHAVDLTAVGLAEIEHRIAHEHAAARA